MHDPSHQTRTGPRGLVLKLAVAVAAAIAIVAFLTMGSSDSVNQASTLAITGLSSGDELPSEDQPLPIAPIATTAPIPTPTPTPTPTSTPIPTPTPTPSPTAESTPEAPEPTAASDQSSAAHTASADTRAGSAGAGQTADPGEGGLEDLGDGDWTQDQGSDQSAGQTPADPQPAPTPQSTPTPAPTPTSIPDPTPQSTPTPTSIPNPTPQSVPTTAPAGGSAAQMEAYVFDAINSLRARNGLSGLTLSPEISAIARDWSAHMASLNQIPHRPQNEMSSLLPPGWSLWGENVSTAPDIYYATSALENSAPHLANLVNPRFTTVGVGVMVLGNGQVFLTQNFAAY